MAYFFKKVFSFLGVPATDMLCEKCTPRKSKQGTAVRVDRWTELSAGRSPSAQLSFLGGRRGLTGQREEDGELPSWRIAVSTT